MIGAAITMAIPVLALCGFGLIAVTLILAASLTAKRRRTYAIGIYSHVLDQWGIIYDQPLVLHQRQAGAAIEGIVRQTAAANVERLAVDTRGYTDFWDGDPSPVVAGSRLYVPYQTGGPMALKAFDLDGIGVCCH